MGERDKERDGFVERTLDADRKRSKESGRVRER